MDKKEKQLIIFPPLFVVAESKIQDEKKNPDARSGINVPDPQHWY